MVQTNHLRARLRQSVVQQRQKVSREKCTGQLSQWKTFAQFRGYRRVEESGNSQTTQSHRAHSQSKYQRKVTQGKRDAILNINEDNHTDHTILTRRINVHGAVA